MKPLYSSSLVQPLGLALFASSLLSGTPLVSSADAIAFIPAPERAAPQQSQGGASRGTVQFIPAPGRQAPAQGSGGASRGEFQFVPAPGRQAPAQGSGGASRGEFQFIPAPERGAPSAGQSGGSRGEYDSAPAPGRVAPSQGASGASRAGEYDFIPDAGRSSVPESGVGGSARTGDEFAAELQPTESTLQTLHVVRPAFAVAASLPSGMMALTPQTLDGITLSGHPTFFFYLPESTAQVGVFRLKDEAGHLLYEQTIPNADQPGVVAIQLPTHLPELEVGKNYQWYVALQFADQLMPTSPFIDAWIGRVEPPAAIAQSTADANTLEYAAALAAAGVWYDAVAVLNTLRANQPGSSALEAHWQELLTSVDLTAVAQAPITVYAAPLPQE